MYRLKTPGSDLPLSVRVLGLRFPNKVSSYFATDSCASQDNGLWCQKMDQNKHRRSNFAPSPHAVQSQSTTVFQYEVTHDVIQGQNELLCTCNHQGMFKTPPRAALKAMLFLRPGKARRSTGTVAGHPQEEWTLRRLKMRSESSTTPLVVESSASG